MIMLASTVWNTLGIIAIIALVFSFFKARNSVWGAATIGMLIGLIVGTIGLFKKTGFDWTGFKRVMIIAVLLGAAFEIFGMLSKRKSN